MATYQVISKQLISNYAVLQLLTPAELEVGQSITVAAVDATFNGTYTIRSLPSYEYIGIDDEGDLEFNPLITIPNQVLYARTAADVARQAASGTLTATPTATWITATDIEDWLGIGTATAADASVPHHLRLKCFAVLLAPKNGSRLCRLPRDGPVARCQTRDDYVWRRVVPSARIHGFLCVLPIHGRSASRRTQRNDPPVVRH
jgi:hypothetical protein